ncbi:hypothetical protein HAX54_020075 [Datura stramonium]|uniref:Uncharacterized protein n=1 Tax=Datura stramonium TaxID=4076 RepID=A0ABS8URZ1_DATST|nr:hypothetical protein [Datura stramonium]
MSTLYKENDELKAKVSDLTWKFLHVHEVIDERMSLLLQKTFWPFQPLNQSSGTAVEVPQRGRRSVYSTNGIAFTVWISHTYPFRTSFKTYLLGIRKEPSLFLLSAHNRREDKNKRSESNEASAPRKTEYSLSLGCFYALVLIQNGHLLFNMKLV